MLAASGEDLPRQDRFVELSPDKDRFGIPLNRVHYPPESSYLTDSQQFVQRDIERRLSSFTGSSSAADPPGNRTSARPAP